ncbi:hypothetical protein [Pectobacterium brasiliense]|uniref:hypothetical protein n=1 Tax=Pectobacterium brasiliense TaxID=180957 RepID=UPI001968C951|nr:hypothetical protein [Pectobacterium brasiliense]MBN3146056.1 hypothetical protein [Pectobacterium brasiliense]
MAITPWSIGFGATGVVIEIAVRKAIEAFTQKSDDASKTSTELLDEAQKAEIKSAVLQTQAKVQQELSIARRILIAEEVEIEEFYDVSGSANAGAKVSKESASIGLQGDGRKITKRVIKFKGFNSQTNNILQTIESEQIQDLTESQDVTAQSNTTPLHQNK